MQLTVGCRAKALMPISRVDGRSHVEAGEIVTII